jgi:hypothetical protein
VTYVIADVSGKGVPSALFMAVCRTLLKATAQAGASPEACLGQVLPTSEACDGADGDCDGFTDEDDAGLRIVRACWTGDGASITDIGGAAARSISSPKKTGRSCLWR